MPSNKKCFKVAIAKGNEYSSTLKSLELIKDEVKQKLAEKKPERILLKPNLVRIRDDRFPFLAITKVETVKAVIDFINALGDFSYLVGDSAPLRRGSNTKEVLKKAGYHVLEKTYNNLKLVDFNDLSAKPLFRARTVEGDHLIRVYEPVLKSKFTVSLAKLKTHASFVNALSLKNFIQGAIHFEDKIYMHGDSRIGDKSLPKDEHWKIKKVAIELMHFNFYRASHYLYPDLAIIDGVEAMEGDGPTLSGAPFKLNLTIASIDPVCADYIATKIMGFDFGDLLWEAKIFSDSKKKVKVVGEKLSAVQVKFKPHSKIHLVKPDKRIFNKLVKNESF